MYFLAITMIGLRSGSLLNKKREKKIGHIMMENFGTLIRYKKNYTKVTLVLFLFDGIYITCFGHGFQTKFYIFKIFFKKIIKVILKLLCFFYQNISIFYFILSYFIFVEPHFDSNKSNRQKNLPNKFF